MAKNVKDSDITVQVPGFGRIRLDQAKRELVRQLKEYLDLAKQEKFESLKLKHDNGFLSVFIDFLERVSKEDK